MATLRQGDTPPPSSRKRVTGPAGKRVTKSAAKPPAARNPQDQAPKNTPSNSGTTTATVEPPADAPTDPPDTDESPGTAATDTAATETDDTGSDAPPPAKTTAKQATKPATKPATATTTRSPKTTATAPKTSPGTPARTAWRAVLVVYVAGVLAAVALGALAPVAPAIQGDFGASLAAVNWAATAITAVGAVLGVYLGIVARRWSRPTFVSTGLVLVAAMAFAGAATWALTPLLLTRVVAGVGYLMVVIACPSLIAQLCTDKNRPTALSIWGTFVSVGLSGSAWLGGLLQPYLGWRGWLAVSGAAALVLAGLVRATTANRAGTGADTGTRPARPTRIPTAALRPVALLSAAFCMTSLTSLGMIMLIPGFLIEERAMSSGWAGTTAAIATIASVPGSLLTGWLMARGVSRGWIALAGLLWIPAGFLVFLRTGPVNVVVAAAIAVAVINGLLVSLSFATVPLTVADTSHLDFANGAVAQLGCLGTLVGPPLIGAIAGHYGWNAVGPFIAATTILAIALLLATLKASRPRPDNDDDVVVAVAGPDIIWAIARGLTGRTRRRSP